MQAQHSWQLKDKPEKEKGSVREGFPPTAPYSPLSLSPGLTFIRVTVRRLHIAPRLFDGTTLYYPPRSLT